MAIRPPSRKAPGRVKYEAITLERGVTQDVEFERWANKVWNYGAGLGQETSLKDFRKEIMLELYNEAGQLVLAYKIYRCWVSEFQALPDLDANANAIAIQHIKLENEGWERDIDVVEPAEIALHRAAAVRDAHDRHGCAVPARVLGASAVVAIRSIARCCCTLPPRRTQIRRRSPIGRLGNATRRCCGCGRRCSVMR